MSESGPQAALRLLFVGRHRADATRYPSASQVLAEALGARGHETQLVSKRSGTLGALREIVRAVRGAKGRFDVVVIDTYSTRALIYARWAGRLARRRGVPYVCILHGGNLPEVARLRPRRLRGLLTGAAVVVAPSRYLAREVGERLGVGVEVIPNPVDLGAAAHRVRTEVAPRLLWVRAFSGEYRPADAVEVLARVAAKHSAASLVMVGPDKDGSLERCRRLAEERGVSARITFTGLVEKARIHALLDEADVFLNTTSVDNTPTSVVEALASGLCVVSTDAGGLPDLLEDGKTALLVRVGDVAGFAAAVERLLTEEDLAAALSRLAREAAADFELDRVVARWEARLRHAAEA